MLRVTKGRLCRIDDLGQRFRRRRLPQPLPEEPVPTVTELPERYPDSWVFVHDLHFNSLPDGRAAIVDVGAENSNLRGQILVAQFGNILPSTTRGEIYVGETFYSRLTRGERTDVITIWDTKTLAPKDEIILPGGKRGLFVTLRNSLQLTNDEKWALVFNFTPGSSVTVVDLAGRKILSDIDLPGCSLVYPTGPRGFTSLCADGTMTSIALDAAGKAGPAVTSTAFNTIDDDPLYMTPAMVGRTGWFVSFKGNLRAIDFAGAAAKDLGGFAIPKQAGGEPEMAPRRLAGDLGRPGRSPLRVDEPQGHRRIAQGRRHRSVGRRPESEDGRPPHRAQEPQRVDRGDAAGKAAARRVAPRWIARRL